MASILGRLIIRQSRGEQRDRRASWSELFFDLAFVVAIGRVASVVGHYPDINEWYQLLLGGAVVLVAWMQVVFYANRFDTKDALHQIALVVQMFGVLVLASSFQMPSPGREIYFDPDRFIAGFLVGRIFLLILYGRVAIISSEARSLAIGIVFFYTITAVGYVIGIGEFGIWPICAAVVLDLLLPIILRPILSSSAAALSNSHLVERFGLLVVLVFGESIASLVNHSHPNSSPVAHWLFMAIALVAVASCWWLYISNIDENAVKRKFSAVIAWELTHVTLLLALIAFGAALHHVLHGALYGTILLYAYAATLMAIGLLHFWCYLSQPDRVALMQTGLRTAGAATVAVIAWFEITHSNIAPIVTVAIVGVIQLIADRLLDS